MTSYFQNLKRSDLDAIIHVRSGETKLGEVIDVPGEESAGEFLGRSRAIFVIIGIPEDIGVLANYGIPGTTSAWNSFLNSFLNAQTNDYTVADTLAVMGRFSFDKLKAEIEKKTIKPEDRITEFRNAVISIDDAVSEVIQLIVSHHKIPIAVGGGHNNSYPMLKGTASALRSQNRQLSNGINCINLDAHIDYRLTEGRHSGNGFKYAKQDGFLRKYLALGIHENYFPEHALVEAIKNEDIAFVTYEDLFVTQRKTWLDVLSDGVKFTADNFTGVELDLDSVSHLPASATSPCGITEREALQYVDFLASHCNVAYLHICEGIASNNAMVGKLISYLVIQFAKAYHKAKK